MSETIAATETVENVETENSETPETVETETVPEMTPVEKAAQAIDALDENDPLLPMIGAFRKVLTEKAEAINALVSEIRLGGEEVETKIDALLLDSTDTEIVEKRNRLEKMRAAADALNSELRSRIAEENDLTPMTEEVKKEKTDAVSELRSKYNGAKSASEKALKNMLPDSADASVYFVDLIAPENVTGAGGTGVKKPRLLSATVEFKGEKETITGTGEFPTFGDVAEFVSKKSGLTNVADRIKPSVISAQALEHGLGDAGVVDFEFTTSEGANKFQIHAETRSA
jgi:hypothetical protein